MSYQDKFIHIRSVTHGAAPYHRSATDTLLAPLSALDQNGVKTSTATLGYVLKSADSGEIEAAAKRVVDKWRLLAGRLEWSKGLSSWCIRIPLEGDVSHRLKFTTSKLDVPLDTPITILNESSAEIFDRPALKFFRHSSTSCSLSTLSSSNAPIVSIHVTELSNCTCVGITVPHGVFDAFGLGEIVRSLDAEMKHKPWIAPVASETNIMREALAELAAASPLYAKEPAGLADVRREFAQTNVKNVVTFAVRNAYEYIWKKTHFKGVFLGQAVVKEMVQKVKDEVRKSGAGWVSTGDVLLAWFLKAAYAKETDKNLSSVISLRSTLADKDPAFENYTLYGATDNSLMPGCMPSLTKAELAAKPLAELALLHRQTIDTARNVPFVQAYNHWMATVGGNGIPTRRLGADSWIFSNQTVGHFDEFDFGSEMFAFWVWNTPLTPDHSVALNKFKGGYLIEAVIRTSRWDALAEDVESMKA
ncbi:hypothetical protein DXG01_008746 [Tephrocybe rancida]|nr:hypothetical protein DXG01_008746 [Tephrocybe rancida]